MYIKSATTLPKNLMLKQRMKWIVVSNRTIKQKLKFTKTKTVKKSTRMSSTLTALALGIKMPHRWLRLSHEPNKTSTITAACFK